MGYTGIFSISARNCSLNQVSLPVAPNGSYKNRLPASICTVGGLLCVNLVWILLRVVCIGALVIPRSSAFWCLLRLPVLLNIWWHMFPRAWILLSRPSGSPWLACEENSLEPRLLAARLLWCSWHWHYWTPSLDYLRRRGSQGSFSHLGQSLV